FHGGRHALDLFHYLHAVGDFAEYGIAPALYGRRAVVEEIVVLDVDEKLRRGRVGFHGAGHRQRTGLVRKAVVGFVLDRRASSFLLHAWLETAALDHEIAD